MTPTLKWIREKKSYWAISKSKFIRRFDIARHDKYRLTVWGSIGILFDFRFKKLKSAKQVCELMENG